MSNQSFSVETANTKPSILVVDDESELCEIISFALEDKFQVQTESQATVAKEILSQKNFDLLLVDLSMPSISGVELAKFAFKVRPQRPPLIVVMTGRLEIEVTDELRDLQPAIVILKPFPSLTDLSQQIWNFWKTHSEVTEASGASSRTQFSKSNHAN